jgi:hypothetical protein|tara:strand:+ start:379 stop:588 length:210 start_codon:yes stop_codon:yes gene_type:complete
VHSLSGRAAKKKAVSCECASACVWQAVEENPAVGTLGALWLELLKAELPPPESAAEVAELLECVLWPPL